MLWFIFFTLYFQELVICCENQTYFLTFFFLFLTDLYCLCFFFSFFFFFPKCCQMCTFFCLTWKRKFSADYTCFLVGLLFYRTGGGGRRVPPVFPNDFGPPQVKKFFVLEKKNTGLEIANLLSCEHVSELSNGRQLSTFLGIFCLVLLAGKNILGVFLSVLPAAGEKFFEGVCFVSKSSQLYTFLELSVIHF